jgi:hypothetical protein
MTSKDKPDYAGFMRKGSTLAQGPQPDRGANHPILEADIPWGEVILDSEEESSVDFYASPFDYVFVNQPPLIPILIIGMLLVGLLFW